MLKVGEITGLQTWSSVNEILQLLLEEALDLLMHEGFQSVSEGKTNWEMALLVQQGQLQMML